MAQEDSIALGLFVLVILAGFYWSARDALGKQPKRAEAGLENPAIIGDARPRQAPVILPKQFFPVTTALIGACILVALSTKMGSSRADMSLLLISDPHSRGLQNITDGQVWRLITPIFLHFGPLHFLFNMLWLWDLGRALEWKKGHWFVIGFVLLVGSASNLAQYLLTGFPFFGGMSGVVYGFLGYIWMQGRHNPHFGIALNKQTVILMLAWFVLCWLGFLGPIANWAHTVGLGMGMVLGYKTHPLAIRGALSK